MATCREAYGDRLIVKEGLWLGVCRLPGPSAPPPCLWPGRLDAVQETLELYDFVQVEQEDQLSGKTYYVDTHCSDLLAFSADQRDFLEQSDLIQNGELVVQVSGPQPGVEYRRHWRHVGQPRARTLGGAPVFSIGSM